MEQLYQFVVNYVGLYLWLARIEEECARKINTQCAPAITDDAPMQPTGENTVTFLDVNADDTYHAQQ